jgi:hypothetical protein
MQNIHQIIQQVEEFASRHGMRPDLVCRKASGNPRLLDRLHRRAAQTEIDIARLLAFMNEATGTNTPSSGPIVSKAQVNKTAPRNKKSVKNGGIA